MRMEHPGIALIAFCGLVAAGSTAAAQVDEENSVTIADYPVEDVVTVFDTYKRAFDLPLTVDVVSGEDLETVLLVHPSEALNRVAGINIHRGSGQEHLTAIRSPVLTGGSGAGSFLYLEDGVPLRAAGFANVNGLFEVGTEFAASVDVIKGPGPATYGSNAVHGLVNIDSRSAHGAVSQFSMMGSDDGFGRVVVSKMIKSNQAAWLASFSLAGDNGFREQSGFDQQKIQLKYEGDFGSDWRIEWLSAFQNLNQETAGFVEGVDAYKDDTLRFTNSNPEAFRDAKSYRTQARFESDIGNNTLALTPYARRVELRFLRHFVPGQALEKNAHSSIGFQSAFFNYDDEDGFNIGFDAEYTKGEVYEFQVNPDRFSFVQGLHYDYEVDAFVAAGYGEKAFGLSDTLSLELGLRGEYTRFDYDNQASNGQSGRFIREADRADDFFTLTPKASLTYKASDDVNIYARAARGARAPQVTDLYSAQLNQVPGQADVETLDSLEAGMKFDNYYASFSAAVFTMWKDNFFFRNANGFNVVNGKTRHSGVEVSFDVPLTDRLSLSGDGTWARHSYDFTEIVGSRANDIIKGGRVDTAPDTLANVRARYNVTDDLMTEIEWRHMGAYFTDPGNTASYSGHDIFVLRAAYEVTDALTLFGRVDNLLDTRYADRADYAFGNERYFPGRPRTLFFGISGTY
ncbi:MAG: TonB-dependent receptor [Alphaproteobacteria bacterium]